MESGISMLLPALTGSCMLYGAGSMDNVMIWSPVKCLMDAETFTQIRRILDGITVNEQTLALDVIRKVGPKGSFIGEKHTVKNYRKEQSVVQYMNRESYGNWLRNGSKSEYERAREKCLDILENHVPTPLAPEKIKAIDDILDEAAEEKGLKGWRDKLGYYI